jgi:hypothetical protein
LQIKTLGQNPSTLSDAIQPQVDLFTLWTQRQNINIGSQSLTFATAAIGFTSFPVLTVPQTQAWWVDKYTVLYTTGVAADYARYAPAILYDPALGGAASHLLAVDVNDAITGRQRQAKATSPLGFWAPPGSQLGVFVFDVLAATTVSLTGIARGTIVPV